MIPSIQSKQRVCDITNEALPHAAYAPERLSLKGTPLLWAMACEIERHAAVREALERIARYDGAGMAGAGLDMKLTARAALAATGAEP